MFQELEKAKREAELEWNSRKTGYEDKLVELEQSRQEAQEFIQKLQKQKMVSLYRKKYIHCQWNILAFCREKIRAAQSHFMISHEWNIVFRQTCVLSIVYG